MAGTSGGLAGTSGDGYYKPNRALLPFALFTLCTVALILSTGGHLDKVVATAPIAGYLAIVEAVLVRISVAIPRGRLNLSALATQVAGMLLPTPVAAALGLFAGISSYSYSPFRRQVAWQLKVGIWSGYAFWTSAGAAVHFVTSPSAVADVAVVLVNTVGNWIGVGLVFYSVYGEPILSVWRRNFSGPWFAAFGTFAAASLVMAHLLREGGLVSFLYASLVPVLSLSLRSQINLSWLRPVVRRSLEQATRQSEYLVELEGGIHDLRNLLMTAQLAVSSDFRSVRRILDEAVLIARRCLSRQEDDGSHFEHLDIQIVVGNSCGLVSPLAKDRNVILEVSVPPGPISVFGDAVLLTELLTNLLHNAIKTTPAGGVVKVTAGMRKGGQRAVSIIDEGKGFRISEKLDAASFANGIVGGEHGIGLRWCQVVALRHLGRLALDESRPTGSVVTLSLPPPQLAQRKLARLRRMA